MALLLAALAHGNAEAIHARLLRLGEGLWPGYAALRIEPVEPTCDPGGGASGASGGVDAADGGGGDEDLLDDLLGAEEEDTAAGEAARAACERRHQQYRERQEARTASVRAFVAVETAVAAVVQAGIEYQRHGLVILLLVCAIAATATRNHIALRPALSPGAERVSQTGQLAANLVLLASSYAKWQVDEEAGIDIHDEALPILWMIGFAILAGINVFHLARRPTGEVRLDVGGLLSVPLYAVMALIAGAYFYLVESHPAGLGIYLQKITEHAILYVQVGLYVWAGMLLKQTRLAPLSFDLVRPWRLPPELLAFVVVTVSAVPTAYSGASGIFVIAAGAVIFQELRRAGASEQLALGATAMSGSLGVVLSPCLLVVIVASLNRQVTTDQLYGWGWRVYLLTALLFFGAMWLVRERRWSIAPSGDAARGTGAAVRALLPYAVVMTAVLLLYAALLDTTLGEHTAPMMLPVLLLAVLLWERRRGPGDEGARAAVVEATSETTGHIGALLLLMALSVSLGGVIERSDLMALVPEQLGSPAVTMSVLVLVLVGIGMVMDPYGAVILVSAAVAPIAYRNGIDPVHFWMVVLVAFELGYLSPPVALNHLLTRQVVGAEASFAGSGEGPFWKRHQRVLVPLGVMVVALLLVAFVPLAVDA